MRRQRKIRRGFTLIEMIVVIVITGILGGVVAMFIRTPMQGYVDSSRRAEMVDIADTALRRIGRDLRTAVPNSVRLPTPAGSSYIEFLPTKNGGRYRANPAGGGGGCGAAGDDLSFLAADTCFEVVGPAISLVRGATDDSSDQIVVGSTQSSGNPPYDKTFAGNGVRRPFTGTTGAQTAIRIVNVQLPAFAELPDQRFDVVPGDQQAVTYACIGTLGTLDANQDGQARLVRYSSYGFNPNQALPATPNPPVLADKISSCNIVYDTFNQRNSLVAITLGITRGGETISLYHEIHVNNVP